VNGLLNLCCWHVAAILEQAMQHESLAVFTRCLALEVDYDGSFPMNLLERLSGVIPNRNYKTEKVRTVLGQFGKSLDEIECPLQPLFSLRTWFVMQSVVPRLKLVKYKSCLLLSEHVLE
jgi:hypothetical protein